MTAELAVGVGCKSVLTRGTGNTETRSVELIFDGAQWSVYEAP